MKSTLSIDRLIQEAAVFAEAESTYDEPTLYGVTDGKAVGTYLEHKFKLYLSALYTYEAGSSAAGIDFPGLGIDLRASSSKIGGKNAFSKKNKRGLGVWRLSDSR